VIAGAGPLPGVRLPRHRQERGHLGSYYSGNHKREHDRRLLWSRGTGADAHIRGHQGHQLCPRFPADGGHVRGLLDHSFDRMAPLCRPFAGYPDALRLRVRPPGDCDQTGPGGPARGAGTHGGHHRHHRRMVRPRQPCPDALRRRIPHGEDEHHRTGLFPRGLLPSQAPALRGGDHDSHLGPAPLVPQIHQDGQIHQGRLARPGCRKPHGDQSIPRV